MSEHRAETPEQVLKFVPKEWPNRHGAQVEEVGQAIVTKIQRAAELSNENCDRALALAHKLSMQLRTAEDRISQLEAEVELSRPRFREDVVAKRILVRKIDRAPDGNDAHVRGERSRFHLDLRRGW